MARVFTITPGLENMGALKTGGQGSVYKGRRTGQIITAIKILPTPVYSESAADKNYVAFENEVAKLKKVNETPNPNVVKILSSGITDTGNFPFIEMEYIQGPDLEELIQPPNGPVFSIKETLKVADQLANAIAHCHRIGVRHGDIKSNNVKFNSETCNYVLLDFGMAMMSDEQRRSSVRHAGSIEFMAPEQNTGQMLFQTDVYSYGIVLFELLTGTVPFPQKASGETGRNEVRLAHMVSPVPDLIELRRSALPSQWNNQTRQHEMQVPDWLVRMIYKCLEKKPEKRFANGGELHDYVVQQFISAPDNAAQITLMAQLEQARQTLVGNQEDLKKQLTEYRQELLKKEGELITIKAQLQNKEVLQPVKIKTVKAVPTVKKSTGVSSASFTALLCVAIALTAFALYPVFKHSNAAGTKTYGSRESGMVPNTNETSEAVPHSSDEAAASGPQQLPENTTADQPLQSLPQQENVSTDQPKDSVVSQPAEKSGEPEKVVQKPVETPAAEKPAAQKNDNDQEPAKPAKQSDENENVTKKPEKQPEQNTDDTNSGKNGVSKKYLVTSKAYFYNDPDENTRRDEFISPLEHAVVLAINERYGFIYVVITNPQGQVFKGWLRKRDLKLYAID